MRWGGDEVGVVLSRNEVWLLLHALAAARLPAVDWEGNALEPWVVGELRTRLQAALRPEPLSDMEERPIIRLDSDMGRSLAMAEVRPLVIEDGYDLGSLFAACAERGWGAELRLPVGGGVATPAEAVVTVGNGQDAMGHGQEAIGSDDLEPRRFVGLERPVVAFARALVGAAFGVQGGESRVADRRSQAEGDAQVADRRSQAGGENDLRSAVGDLQSTADGLRAFDEHVIFSDAIAPGERDKTVSRMAGRGWELVGEEDGKLVFRRRVEG